LILKVTSLACLKSPGDTRVKRKSKPPLSGAAVKLNTAKADKGRDKEKKKGDANNKKAKKAFFAETVIFSIYWCGINTF